MIGTKLAHYEITSHLGSGGMGDVYQATDSKLGRSVAVKFLPESFAHDADRVARFEREARVLASLNHPNIAAIYGLEEARDKKFLVMELVSGETLAERIRRGPIPLDDALIIAKQIAEALEAAHERGIVHRDLKPANIKVTTDGKVKVLDFGLAKGYGQQDASSPMLSNSPTVGSAVATNAGIILGTAAYMSPEQVLGKLVDRRTDVWAFGVVLYEMLSGERLHQGESVQELMASVLKDEPDMKKVSPRVHRMLKRCLQKDPNNRLRHVGDVMSLVDDADVSMPSTGAASTVAEKISPRMKWLWPAIAFVTIAAAAALYWAVWRTPTASQAVRFEVGPAPGMTFNPGAYMFVSPNGRWMVFPAIGETGPTRLWLRALDGVDVRPLSGTEAPGIASPASFTHDSRWVLFAYGSGLKKVDVQGGPPQTIAAEFPGSLNGATSNSGGIILAGSSTPGNPIFRAYAAGGAITPATALTAGEEGHRFPQFLPDEKHFLYFRASSDAAKTGIYVGDIGVKPTEQSMEPLLVTDRQAYYAPLPGFSTGHLIFLRQATLMAQPFDPRTRQLKGDPVAIAEGVDSFAARNAGLFSVSDTGTLVYRMGASPKSSLAWVDAQGHTETLGESGEYANPSISPDARRVAVALGTGTNKDIWILDVARGTSTRFTFDPGEDNYPTWSRDGKDIAFLSSRGGEWGIYVKPSDNSGEEKLLWKSPEPKLFLQWSRDGKFLLFSSQGPKTASDVWVLAVASPSQPVPLIQTQFPESMPALSWDGRWIAYTSLDSGTPEIYVRPFTPENGAGVGAKWLISKGTGIRPIWGVNSKELYYVNTGAQLMVADIDTSKGFQVVGGPRRLLAAAPETLTSGWDLSPDGKRFLFVAQPGSGRVIPFTVVLNWSAALKN